MDREGLQQKPSRNLRLQDKNLADTTQQNLGRSLICDYWMDGQMDKWIDKNIDRQRESRQNAKKTCRNLT